MKDSNRKLAAILFADIVGYTSLMQSNEQRALQTIQHYQSILSAYAKSYNGEIFKNYGDGSLLIFQNSLEAVQAAKEIQEKCNDPFSEITIPLRIGIHVGEFVVRDQDIYGNGVNLASRLESMGVAGSVLFSRDIYRKIKNHPELKVQSLGSFAFKNVEEPMEVFALANDGFVVPKRSNIKGKLKEKTTNWLPWLVGALLLLSGTGVWYFNQQATNSKETIVQKASLKSIGVLPFKNISGDNSINYFGAGIREEITTQLIGIQALEVFSSEVANQFDVAKMSMLDFGKEKGIAHLLIGSVRTDEQQNRIVDTKLLDTGSGKYLWAATFKEGEVAVTAFQKEIVKKIIEGLQLKLSLQERTILNETITDNTEAYELYLKASQYKSFNGDSTRIHRIIPLQKCLQLDSNFHQVYIELAASYIQLAEWALEPSLPNWRAAQRYIRQAIKHFPNNARALNVLAQVQKNFEWDFKAAEQTFLKAIKLDPKYQEHYVFYLITVGQTEKAVQQRLEEIENYATIKEEDDVFLAFLYNLNKQFDKANQIVDALDSAALNRIDNHFFTAEHFAFRGNAKKAIEFYEKSIPNEAILSAFKGYQLGKSGNRKAAEQIKLNLLDLAKTARVSPVHIAIIEIGLGNLDAAFMYLEQAYQQNDSLIINLQIFAPYHDAVFRADPRYAALLKKIGLK